VKDHAVKRIDFFIVEAQKCGTTALSSKLSRHPDLCCAVPKELHLFDSERRDWARAPAPKVSHYFPPGSDSKLWGEATPVYFYWPQSIERLVNYNPLAKLIIGLRHPAFRALSHWKMEVTRRAENLSFATAISEEGRARVISAPRQYSYVERGFYAAQVSRVLAHFPRQAVFFYRMEDLYCREADVLDAISTFLDVGGRTFDPGPKHVVPVDSSAIRIDASDELRYLSRLYATDIRETARLTGLELDSWIEGTYSEAYLECP
jgi:hypothetical protein